ncbi:histidine phosphatase [Arthrobacter sp. EpRS66]|nr:histidine phosphatase [Arthrobacter sp. EpRS66]
MRLILIRHGQTASNIGRHLDTGVPGAPLTELGHEQAAALPATLDGEKIDAIYASNLLRTQQTAAPLARSRGLEIQIRPGLREISAGDLEMANDENSIQTYLKVVMDWADGATHAVMPGTDRTGAQVLHDFDEVVEEILAMGVENAVAVSHGAIIRAWVGSRAINLEPGFTAHTPVSNTGVVVLEHIEDHWAVVRWQEQALGGLELNAKGADGAVGQTQNAQ